MPKLRLPALVLAIAALAAVPAPAVADDDDDRELVDIDVLSSRADEVSGGDALVKIEASRHERDDLRVLLNGSDVTEAFESGHGSWRPNGAERARLEQIFPAGVCDYSREDVGRP